MTGGGFWGAEAAVRAAVARFSRVQARERTRLHRLHLQAGVTSASPIAADLARTAGLDLADVARLLPVPRVLPGLPGRHPRMWPARLPSSPSAAGPDPGEDLAPSVRAGLRLGHGGVVVRAAGDPDGELGFTVEGEVLEAVASVRGRHLETRAGFATLDLAAAPPETALAALVGRPVGALVAHGLFDGRDYPVVGVSGHSSGDGVVIEFSTGLLPLRMPWPDLLADALAEAQAERDFLRRRDGPGPDERWEDE